MAMSCELNLNQREKKDIDTASCHRSRAPDGHAPVVIYRRARPATATIRGRFRLFLLGWLDKMIRAVRMGRDLRSTALGQDRKSTRLNSSHYCASRMPSS